MQSVRILLISFTLYNCRRAVQAKEHIIEILNKLWQNNDLVNLLVYKFFGKCLKLLNSLIKHLSRKITHKDHTNFVEFSESENVDINLKMVISFN